MSTEDAFLSNIITFTNAIFKHYGTIHKPLPKVTQYGLLMPSFTNQEYINKMMEDSSVIVRGNYEPHTKMQVTSLIYQAESVMGFSKVSTSSPASPDVSDVEMSPDDDDDASDIDETIAKSPPPPQTASPTKSQNLPILDITGKDFEFPSAKIPSCNGSLSDHFSVNNDDIFEDSELPPFEEILKTSTYYALTVESISSDEDVKMTKIKRITKEKKVREKGTEDLKWAAEIRTHATK